jgi:hypothetical protein
VRAGEPAGRIHCTWDPTRPSETLYYQADGMLFGDFPRKSARRADRGQLRSGPAPGTDSAQGGEGWVIPLRRQLLAPIPTGGPPCADDRQRHEPYRLSLHKPHSAFSYHLNSIPIILDGDAAKAWLDKYCRENPTNTFAKASDELYLFVRSIGQ